MKYAILSLALLLCLGCVEESCSADGQARNSLFVSELQRLGADGTFAVFSSGSEFVQFAGDGGSIILDVPSGQLGGGRQAKLESLLGSKTYMNQYEGGYSIQATFTDASQAAAMAERVFTEVYGLPADYPITSVSTESSETSYSCG